MKMWTFILAGLLLATLGRALEDANVSVNGTFSQGKFELRVWPEGTKAVCATTSALTIDWFRISQWQQTIQDFAGGKNNKNATYRLGTTSFGIVYLTPNLTMTLSFCNNLPTANQNVTAYGALANIVRLTPKPQYFAVKVNNTLQATMRKGFNYVKNLVQNRFQNKSGMNPVLMAVEIAASGQVYVGVMKDLPYP